MLRVLLAGGLFTSLLFQLSFGQSLQGTTYAEAQASRKGTLVYTYVTTPGFAENDASGNLKGLSVEIMDAFVAWVKEEKGIVLGSDVQTRGNASVFPNFMQNITQARGGVFGLGNITITPQRQQEFHMSTPILPNVSVMITNNRVPTLQSMRDMATTFAGFTCYVVRGTTNAKRMQELASEYYPGLNIVEVETSEESLQLVAENPKSFTNLDFTYYIAIFKRGLPIKRHPAGDSSDEELGIIMPKSNDWAPLLNEFLASGFLESSEYRTLLTKHLHRDILAILDSM